MNIIEKRVKDLKPYEKNPRLNDDAVKYVAESIKEFGFKVPIVIDKDNNIVCGHTRWKACKKLKIDTVPCVVADDLTEEQIRAYRLADNKVGEKAEWDLALLDTELAEIETIDMTLLGFDEKEEPPQEVVEDDFDEEPPAEPKSKYGDLYQLGRHKLLCGDSTKIEDVQCLLGGDKADMVFTDPPYNVAFNGRSGKFDVIKNDDLSNEDFDVFIKATLNTIKSLKPKAYYVCCNWAFYGILQKELDPKACIVWAKNVFGLGKGYRHQHEFILFNGFIKEDIKNETDLWNIKKDHNYKHPTQKPIAIPSRAIQNSTNEGENVVDLFGGSGSTLIACEQLNRQCFMMELDPKYIDVIINRWETFTGKKAELINGNRKAES